MTCGTLPGGEDLLATLGIALGNVNLFETVASLQRIDGDMLIAFPYFSGPNLTKEGDHGWTGRVRGG